MATTSNHLAPALEVRQLTKQQRTKIFYLEKIYPQSVDAQNLAIVKYWLSKAINIVSVNSMTCGWLYALNQAQAITRSLVADTPVLGPLTAIAIAKLQQTLNTDPCSHAFVTVLSQMQTAQLTQMYLQAYASVCSMHWHA